MAWALWRSRWLPAGDIGEPARSSRNFLKRGAAHRQARQPARRRLDMLPPRGQDTVRGQVWDIHPHDLPLSGWLLAHDIRVLMTVPLEPRSFCFGLSCSMGAVSHALDDRRNGLRRTIEWIWPPTRPMSAGGP